GVCANHRCHSSGVVLVSNGFICPADQNSPCSSDRSILAVVSTEKQARIYATYVFTICHFLLAKNCGFITARAPTAKITEKAAASAGICLVMKDLRGPTS